MNRVFVEALFALCLASKVAAEAGSEFNGDEYISLSRQEKQEKIWQKVTENDQMGDWHVLRVMFQNVDAAFDTPGDEFECEGIWGCRKKAVHSQGMVGKVRWLDQGNHPYTGIFRGSDSAFVRFSTALAVGSSAMTPGMALKFLRDGLDSANFVAMEGVEGQASGNYFEKNWANHIIDPVKLMTVPLGIRFASASVKVQTVGLSDMAQWTETGDMEYPVFPYKLIFFPALSFPDDFSINYMQSLGAVPSGTKLFDVYALDAPVEAGGTASLIAELRSDSEIVTSWWGDNHMYFRHQRMEDDLAYRPEWTPHVPEFRLDGLENKMGCPLGFLFELLL